MQSSQGKTQSVGDIEQRAQALLEQMTLAEKVGQMNQRNASEGWAPDYLSDRVRAGLLGSAINIVDVDAINELQRIAVEESRLKIPLLIGRDVIHGFRTIMPIPLGQAATWNPGLVKQGAHIAAREAVSSGVNWTFAPMIDIARDARWGRIAESFGEDVFLCSKFAVAMVEGFQSDDLTAADAIASCVKHFAGYGASESGRDYATTNIAEHELRNVYLPPFKAAINAGAMTLMTSFSDINGVPATGNEFLLRQILREEWDFDGLVVSDWESIRQLEVHGFTENAKESAFEAVTAGVDMEMAGDAYSKHLQELLDEGRISLATIDQSVLNILRTKFRLGLFDRSFTSAKAIPPSSGTNASERAVSETGMLSADALDIAKQLATQSVVMLKNDHNTLPLALPELKSVAVIGPLADAPYEQLGTWIFDGDAGDTITPLRAIRELAESQVEVNLNDANLIDYNPVDVKHVQAMQTSRSRCSDAFDDAVEVAASVDVAIVILGEESILSGEAHSRADINLPGDQTELVRRLRKTGTPLIAVIMAGRPLTLTNIVDQVDALLFAWHPGTMGGPAIADLIFGVVSPSGKLPATFPRMVGQIPIYYNQKNTGKPPSPDTVVHIDEIDTFAPQTSFGMTAFHLDAGYRPLYPFGYGLSYTEFHYQDLTLSSEILKRGDALAISVTLSNVGAIAADEVVQLYVRDLVGQVTRPVKELKGFQRVHLLPGQSKQLAFTLLAEDLAFYGRRMQEVIEPGKYHLWIGGSSETSLQAEFTLVE